MARQTISDTSSTAGWQALTPVYSTGLGAYGGGYGPWYKKDNDGMVQLGGLVKVTATTAASSILVLPVGIRPVTGGGLEEYMSIGVYYGTYSAQMAYFYPNGTMIVPNYTATVGYWYSLGNVRFSTV